MANRIRVAIVGYGNIGRAALQAVVASDDMELAGVVRRDVSHVPAELRDVKVVADVQELEKVQVALLCVPSRMVPDYAKRVLALGINTVDSFDIHSSIPELLPELDKEARTHRAVSVISAGWDPGCDSVVRTLLCVMAPKGVTYTNFGPGMSMGHSVAVRGVAGVRDALSMTIPLGTGIHRRMVYVELEKGTDFGDVERAIKEDPYFVNDETHVTEVASVDALRDMGHGVNLVRKGVSGVTQNQLFEFNMRINNPALTGQVMVACARASMRLQAGCYTMIDIPPIAFLPGERLELIKGLV